MLQWPYELELFVTQPRFLVKDKLHPERLLKNKMESKIMYTSMCHECHVNAFLRAVQFFWKEGNTGKHRWKPFLTIVLVSFPFLLVRKRPNHSETIMCLCACVCWVVLPIGLCLMLRMCVCFLCISWYDLRWC